MGDSKERDDTSYPEGESAYTGEERRLLLYDEAVKLKAAGHPDEALTYFTKCLEGVDSSNQFTKLPHCLREIAAIYYDKEEYEKAVQFAQAEKLYYEAALIDSTNTTSSRNTTHNNPTDNHYIQKANEYERLASLCLKEHKIHLALEYCGKVAKIRQLALGPSNPATVQSLDMFTVLYAEAGRQQYADALRMASNAAVVKDDGEVTTCMEQSNDQKDCKQNCDESEMSEISKSELTNSNFVDSKTITVMYSNKAILLYFLLSSILAVMLSFWILW